ncbi:MAG: carboxypeptidase-like regulatory domain-containing protein, partial [Pyrinomonadaceae bacterium]
DAQTGKERTVISNSDGGFTVPLLDVGKYTVKVSSKGFKSTTTTVTIQIAQEYSLSVQLSVGDVSENVTVTGGADIVNSTNGELSSTLTNRQITELPLATRNPLALILTQAGSASNPSQNTSIDGGRTSSTNITRDGVNIQDNFIRSNATDFSPGRPSVDNVEEFTLTAQSAVDAGFGSAQVNFVTPRGGNQFHGAGWEYNRNSAVGANSWFANAGGNYLATDKAVVNGFRQAGEEISPRPFRNRNQYGVKVSGPIIKDKLFFFAYGEKLNDIVTASRVQTVLTASARTGIFQYVDAGGITRSVNIFTPGAFTANPATGNAAPTSINSLVNSTYLTGMRDGNSFEAGDGLNTTGVRFFQNANQTRDSLTSRLDYDLNSKNNINGVIDYNFEHNLRNDIDLFNPVPDVTQPARNVLYSGGWRYSPTANISNEFRIGRIYSKPDFFRTDAAKSEYYQPILISSPEPQNGGVFRNQGRAVKTVNAQDTVSWLVGNHSLRFGVQFQRVAISAYNDAGNLPAYNFGFSANGPIFSAATLGAAGGAPLSSSQQTSAKNLYALLGGLIS